MMHLRSVSRRHTSSAKEDDEQCNVWLSDKKTLKPKTYSRETDSKLSKSRSHFHQVLQKHLEKNLSSLDHKDKFSQEKPVEECSESKETFLVQLNYKVVDLADYCRENSKGDLNPPLYALCRRWLRSGCALPEHLIQPPKKATLPILDPYEPDLPSAKTCDVYRLPKPDPLPKDALGNPVNLRIPSIVREYKPRVKEDLEKEINALSHLSGADLLAMHQSRWRQVRQQFAEAARENRHRYRHSLHVLLSMFQQNHTPSQQESLKYPLYEEEQ